ncbi:MAG TPA: hypothetical protein VK034_19125, partial [Enhygromyxa sp.]|nr:hypothetical protein [Enhygromyxa sp.]
MRLVHAWLSISLVTACTGKRDDGEATTTTDRPAVDERDEQVGEPDADAARDPSEPRRRLLLLAHEPTAEQATLRAVELGSLAVGEALTIPAATMDHWPGHFRVVAAHGGGDRFMIARLDASAWTVERRSLVGEPSVAIEVGEQPIATLHMVGERVFVGQGNRVRSIDLSAATPTVADLHQRPEMQFKAYDLFARDGAWLVAI